MATFIAFALACLAGAMVARRRALWQNVLTIGAFLGIAFTALERNPEYLIATLILGAVYLWSIRGTDPHQSTNAAG